MKHIDLTDEVSTMVLADSFPAQHPSIGILKIFCYIDCLFYRRHAPAKFITNLSKKTTIHARSRKQEKE